MSHRTVGRRHRAYAAVAAGLACVSLFTLLLLLSIAPSGFPAHISCWQSSPGLVALHLIGDLLVWGAYMAIPFLFLYLMVVGRVDESAPITFPTLVGWGALFVWCCGQTHLLDVLEIWWQIQWQRGIVKVLTGIVSWVFVGLLVRNRLRLIAVARAIYRAFLEEPA